MTKALGTGFVTTAFKAGRCPEDALTAAGRSMAELNKAASEAAVAVGAHGATDITGFGLAGHAAQMAQSSAATLVFDSRRLPILPGAYELARQGNRTRASTTNRSFVEPSLRIEGRPDPVRLEMFFDAQTSGGLLISVPAEREEELIERIGNTGGGAASLVGSVTEKQDVSIILRP
jgi:selenide,water dikinase